MNRKFTLIYKPQKEVLDAILDVYKAGVNIIDNHRGPLKIDLEEPIHSNTLITKIVLWHPDDSPGTVIFGNQRDGFETLGCILNNRYGFEMTRIGISFESEKDEGYGPFIKFQHSFTDGRERYVRVMWDDRWDFYQEGDPFPFEQTERYTERIKRKRLTTEMVLDYAREMGWDLRDPHFWTPSEDASYLTYEFIPEDKK